MNGDSPTNNTTPDAGWYPDPATSEDSGILRYWDGQQWTEETKETLSAFPPPMPSSTTTVSPPPVFQPASSPKLIMSPFGQYYSGWWRRAGATLVDSFITTVVIATLAIPLMLLYVFSLSENEINNLVNSDGSLDTGQGLIWLIALISLFGAVTVFLYQVIQLSLWGKTIGDRALGIRVAAASTGDIPSWGQNVRRALVLSGFSLGGLIPVVGVFFLIGSIVNYFSMLWDSQRRCWHDILGGTVVLKTSA